MLSSISVATMTGFPTARHARTCFVGFWLVGWEVVSAFASFRPRCLVGVTDMGQDPYMPTNGWMYTYMSINPLPRTIIFCMLVTSSTGISTPKSPRATMMLSVGSDAIGCQDGKKGWVVRTI